MKPRVFIGSSVEGKTVSYSAQQNLMHEAEVTVWDQGVFQLSQSSLESLVTSLDSFDFGIFVFSADDVTTIRNVDHLTARDNVLFELGLFIGKLGRKRCFILKPDSDESLHLPTDLLGVEPATYETNRTDENWQAATSVACQRIRLAIEKEGRRSISPAHAEGVGPGPSQGVEDTRGKDPTIQIANEEDRKEEKDETEAWLLAFVQRQFSDAIQHLDALLAEEPRREDWLDLRCFRAQSVFKTSAAAGVEAFRELIKDAPTEWKPRSFLIYALLASGFAKEALDEAEDSLESFPDSIDLIQAKARCLAWLERHVSAIELLEEVIERRPAEEIPYAELVRIHVASHNDMEAQKAVGRGLEHCPLSTTLLEAQATLFFDQRQFARCILTYQKLINLDPQNPGYPTLLGNALLELDLHGLALDSYTLGDRLSGGKQAWIIANIGNVLNVRGFFGQAVERFEHALRLAPAQEYAQERLVTAKKDREEERSRLQKHLMEAKQQDTTTNDQTVESDVQSGSLTAAEGRGDKEETEIGPG